MISIYRDVDGSFWFGTRSGGMTHYHREDTVKPSARIVSVRTDALYTDLGAISPITTGSRVTIEYGSIDFKTLPEKRQYRHRIKEIDANWHSPTKETTFDTKFAKPGTYTFSVQAIDRDLNYSEPTTLTLDVISDPRNQQIAQLESEIEKRNRELEAELQDAHDVQMSLMPKSAPRVAGLDIAGRCLPATEVSGDFFDYLQSQSGDEISIVVGDVTGHGMRGAMNAMMTDGILRATAREQIHFSPASLMGTLNDVLNGRMDELMNVTMVIGLINGVAKTLTLANAGHHAYPLLVRDRTVEQLVSKGMPLGMMAGIAYREIVFQLQSGDVLTTRTITSQIKETHAKEESLRDY